MRHHLCHCAASLAQLPFAKETDESYDSKNKTFLAHRASCEHHLAGAKLAKTRFSALLEVPEVDVVEVAQPKKKAKKGSK